MAFCNIEKKHRDNVLIIVAKRVKANQQAGTDFSIAKEMKDLYDNLISRGMEVERALSLVSLMPTFAIVTIGNPLVSRYINKYSAEIYAAEDAAKNYDDLVSYMNLNAPTEKEADAEVAEKQEEEKTQVKEKVESGSNLRTLVFNPFTNSVLEVKDGKVLDDPASKASMKFIRENVFAPATKRLDETGYYQQTKVNSPYRMSIVLGSTIPAESRVKDETGTELREYQGLILAVTDAQGNPITTEVDGKQYQVHTFMRSARALRESNKRAKEGDKVIQEENVVKYETMLANMQDALTKNPELKLLFEITGYTGGVALFITKDSNKQPTKISEVKNFTVDQLAENLHVEWIKDQSVSDKEVPNYYFTAPNFGYKIPVARPQFSKTSFAGIAREILTSELPVEEKQRLLGDIIYFEGIKDFTEQGITEAFNRLPLQLPTGKNSVNFPVKTEAGYELQSQPLAEFVYNNAEIRVDLSKTGGELLSYSPVIRYKVTPDVLAQYTVGYKSQKAPQPQAGAEISSSAKGLAAALTNPTELAKSKGNLTQSYPVEFRGKTYKDAEAAYQALKSTASKEEPGSMTDTVSVSQEQFKTQLDILLKTALKQLKKANSTGKQYVLGFHGGQEFITPDRSKQYSGEFRDPDIRRVAESMGSRYEGLMLFYTQNLDDKNFPFTYENAIYEAANYAIRYGDDAPTVYAYLIPVDQADFTDRGVGEVGLSYDAIEKGLYQEAGRTGFKRKLEPVYTTYDLMVDIIKAKLTQHPRLVSEITKQGGSQWLLSSTHQPTKKNTVWETGGRNWFIKALNEAYAATEPFVEAIQVEQRVEDLKSGKTVITLEDQIPDNQAEVVNFLKSRLKKSKGQSNEATQKQIDAAEEWYNNSPLSKVVPFNRMLHIVNSKALADFTGYAINLYAGSNATDLYHEAWHGFSQLYLSKEEKIALYEEVKKLQGAMTYLEAEEFLAEDFRLFAISGGRASAVKGKVKQGIFRKIWNLLRSLFGNKTYAQLTQEDAANNIIAEYYEKLFVGDISEYRPSIDNALFGELNKAKGIKVNATDEVHTHLTPKESFDVSASIDGLFAEAIVLSGLNTEILAGDKEVIPALYKYARISFINKITELEQALVETDDVGEQLLIRKRIGVLEKALTNFPTEITRETVENAAEDSVIGYHKDNSKYIQELNSVIGILDSSYELDEQMNAMVRQDKSGNESSMVETSYPIVLYSIRSMRSLKGKPGQYVAETNEYGFPKLVEFSKGFNYVAQALEGMSSVEDMHNRLRKLEQTFPAVADLRRQLGQYGDTSLDTRFDYETKVWQSFEKAVVPLSVILGQQYYTKSVDDRDRVTLRATGELSLKPQEASADSVVSQVLAREFHNYEGKYSKIINGKRSVNLPQLLAQFPTITSDNIVEFLKELGVVSNTTPLFDAMVSEPSIVKEWQQVRLELNYYAEVRPTIESQNAVTRKFKSKTGEFRGHAGRLKNIVEIYARSMGQDSLGAQVNANGDREYGRTLHNTATRLVQNLNKVNNLNEIKDNPTLKHLHPDNNPAMLTHPWMREMFDMTSTDPAKRYSRRFWKNQPITLETYQVNGLAIQDVYVNEKGAATLQEPQGKKNMQMDAVTKLLSDIHFLMGRGMMEIPRASDKSTSLGVRLNVQVNKTSVNQLAKGAYFGPGAFYTPAGINASVDMLINILAGEIIRMQKYSDNARLNKITTLDITYPTKEGQEKLIDGVLLDKVQELVNQKDITAQQIVNTLEKDTNFKAELGSRFANYLAAEVAVVKRDVLDTISEALTGKTGLMPSVSPEVKQFFNEETGVQYSGSAALSILRSLAANTFFNNINVIDMFAGGMHNYKNADDFTKRLAITSTGQVFRSDAGAIDYINERVGKPFAKAMGHTPTAYSPVLRTVVLKDVEVSAKEEWLAAAKEYLTEDAYTKYAGKINEADAQGYISFDTYRILSKLEGTWTDAQEAVFQTLVRNPNAAIDQVEEYFPVRKFQYYGPLVNGTMQQALHKYSLMPMIPNVIKGRGLESLHSQMMANNIDYVMFESANKVGLVGEKVEAFEEVNGGRRVKNNLPLSENVNEIHTDYLKDQLFINSKFKGKITRSTQLGKLLGNAIYDAGVATNPELAVALERYEAALDKYIGKEATKLIEQIKSPEDLVKLMRNELDKRDIAEFKIQSIQAVDGKLVYNLDALPSADDLARIASALVNKRLLRAKLSGEQLVQVASTGFENAIEQTGEEIQKPESVKTSNDLRFYTINADGSVSAAQVKIALQGEYKKLLLGTHPDGKQIKTLARLNEAIKDEQWLNEGNNRAMVSLTGVRIPVQGLNSMEFFEVAEFLPETAGNIIVVPTEITMKAGSDFDIDKLTMYMPSINVAPNPQQIVKSFGGIEVESGYIKESVLNKLAKENPEYANDLTSQNTDILIDTLLNKATVYKLTERDQEVIDILKKAKAIPSTRKPELATEDAGGLQNELIGSMRTILLSKDNYAALINPNSTDLVKENSEAYKKLSAEKSSQPKISHPASYSYNLGKHQDNSIMKRALGIGAKGNTFNSLFQRTGKQLPQYISNPNDGKLGPIAVTEIGLFENSPVIGELTTANGQSKSDIINQLINGWVDAGKDPWIADIGADDIIAPLLISMVDMGIDYNYAVKFLNHPAVKRYAILKRMQTSPVKGFYFNPFLLDGESNNLLTPEFRDFGIFKNLFGLQGEQYISTFDLVSYAYSAIGGVTKMTRDRILAEWESENPEKVAKGRGPMFKPKVGKASAKILSESELSTASDLQILGRLYLFTKLSEDLKQLRMKMDLDTSKSNDIFDAAVAVDNVNAVLEGNLSEIARDIYDKSIIKTFKKVKEAQSKIFNSFFSLRSDAVLLEQLMDIVKQKEFANTNPFEDRETFIKKFISDFNMALYQQSMHPVDIFDVTSGNVKEYKGIPIVIQNVQEGAIAINGKIVVNPTLLLREFQQRQSTDNASMPFKNTREFMSYILEREYLRGQEQYANLSGRELGIQAIRNTFNMDVMLGMRPGTTKGLADQWLSIKDNPEYSEFLSGFRLTNLLYKAQEGAAYLLNINSRVAAEDQDALHEEILQLQNAVDFPEISAFFRTLPLKLFYIHGMNGSRIMSIMPQTAVAAVLNDAIKAYKSGNKSAIVIEFAERFASQNNSSINPNRRFTRNYVAPSSATSAAIAAAKKAVDEVEDIFVTDEDIIEFRKKCQG